MTDSNGTTTATAPVCGTCGEAFAGPVTAAGTTPIITGALHAGAGAAGWVQKDGTWTCTVCLTGRPHGPGREPFPVLADPDADPLDVHAAALSDIDAGVGGMWIEVNRRNNAAASRNTLRFNDGRHGFEALFHRAPDLRDDPEAAVALLNYEADLMEQRDAMHRASEARVAELRDRTSLDMAVAS